MNVFSANPVDPGLALRAEAESYAFHAALVSIPLIIASMAILLFARSSLRGASLTATLLCVHPAWMITETWYDNGATLRLASTAWIVLACTALALALLSLVRHGIQPGFRFRLRFTSRGLVMLTTVIAMALVLSRPPLSDFVQVSRSLSGMALVLMLIIALHAPSRTRHRKLPRQLPVTPAQIPTSPK